MGSIIVIGTAVLALVIGLMNFYYSYNAKKMLEEGLEDTEIELMMATRPLLVIRAVVHEGAMTYEHDTLSAPVGTKTSDDHPHDTLSAPVGTKTSDDRPLASHFSHFELFNAGNSPAIGLEISLMNEEKVILQSESLGFLRNNEQALSFIPIKLETHKTYYLVSEYESVRSRVRKLWYQTWLPFTTVESVAKNTINVNVGELDFKEVSIIERIDALSTKEKPH